MGVQSVGLYAAREPFWRLDVWPFVLAQALNFVLLVLRASSVANAAASEAPDSNAALQLQANTTESVLQQTMGSGGPANATQNAEGYVVWGLSLPLLHTVLLPVLAVLQLLAWLGTHWSVKFKALVTLKPVKNVTQAAQVLVEPSKPTMKVGLCALEKVCLRNTASNVEEELASFDFHKRRYLWEPGEKKWQKVAFPVGESMRFYANSRGLPDDDAVCDAARRWGVNSFEIPLPTYKQLYAEQCRQPFFVFQVACVVLWSLDEYWIYSLFTLLMLLLFEGTVVLSRTRNLKMLREMMGAPVVVRVHRKGQWMTMHSNHLVPGDLISLNRNKHDPDQTVPADVLLLNGKVIVSEAILTGEATPQEKVSIVARDPDEVLSLKRSDDTGDQQHIVFGGTKILQVIPDLDAAVESPAARGRGSKGLGLQRPPDGGCLGVVVRNGFNTAQGRLVRTILFSAESTTAASREAGIFILCLLCFALAASGYVLSVSWHDPARNKSKLLINCAMILASVVPPELPMNLSLAVNSSLASLANLGVFCTEPFRIPFAGKVGVCCFDKTGTLTSEDLVLEGVAGAAPGDREETGIEGKGDDAHWSLVKGGEPALPADTVHVLVGCHGLVHIDDVVIGETMERVALQALGWSLGRNDAVLALNSQRRIQVLKRFAFASSLARMSTIAEVKGPGGTRMMVLSKGAPEVMAERFVELPRLYEQSYKSYTRQGARVLALGYRELATENVSKIKAKKRDDVECDLVFAGLVVFHCPNKFESETSIKALKDSGHHLVMITGDQTLTACHVARELGMCSRQQTLILTQGGVRGCHCLEWRTPDDKTVVPFDPTGDHLQLSREFDLCVPGAAWGWLEHDVLLRLIEFVRVFARVRPNQKEAVLLQLKAAGHYTIMCGDGTNDVGALKASHVGIALLSAPLAEDEGESAVQRRVKGADGDSSAPALNKASRPPTLRELQLRLENQMADEEPTFVRLGDASIASPFTCRQSSIYPTTRIIQQGRCTLVTTMQIYKIQALTCLSMAYCMSALYLDGVKLGDSQMILSGLTSAMLFLLMSHAKPLTTLASTRPPASICCTYMVAGILGQFAVHMWALLTAIDMARPLVVQAWVCSAEATNSTLAKEEGLPAPACAGECFDLGCNGCLGGTCVSSRDPDANFSPNVLNSVVFLITTVSQVTTFAVNYKGRPHMQGLREHKPLAYSLMAAMVTLHVCALEVAPALNSYLQLTPMPSDNFKLSLWALMLVDFVGAFLVEVVVSFLFFRSACRGATDRLLRS